MPKFILILLTVFLFTACKKEYTCECRRETGSFIASYTIKEKKEKAAETCEATQVRYSAVLTANCALK